MKVLICDKELVVQKLLRRELENHELEVITANDGYIGLEMVKKERPDIIITDLLLPLVNGLEYIAKINKELPNSSIIVYSEIHSQKIIEEIYFLGAKDFIYKPFDPERLFLRIKRLLPNIK